MSRRLTYEFVKNYIEKENYQLLSTEYKNTHAKLTIKCEKNHIFEMRFYSFKKGQRCPICFGTPKLTYDYVKEYIELNDYILISTEYKGNKSKLKIQCDKGHKYEVKFNSFQQGRRCPICFGTPKHTYEYIKNFFKNECDKGHEYEVVFNNFKSNNSRCPVCNISKSTSRGEKEVLNYVKSIYSGKIIENDRTQILNPLTNRYLELDIFLAEIKFAIEYNGDYHHSMPYQIQKDIIKVNQCKKLNIDLLVIDDSEWRNNKNQCKKLIYKRIF